MSSPLLVKISRDGKEIGTYEAKEAVRLLVYGTLKETDFYWHEGMTQWVWLSKLQASEARRMQVEEFKPIRTRPLNPGIEDTPYRPMPSDVFLGPEVPPTPPLNYRIAQPGGDGTDALGEVFLLPRGITGNFTEVGGYDLAEVFRLLEVGTLKPTDVYKTEGMTSWNLLSNLEKQHGYFGF